MTLPKSLLTCPLLSIGAMVFFSQIQANADLLVDQYPGGATGPGTTFAQEYTDVDPLFSSYIFDDFTVGAGGWNINQITAYGRDTAFLRDTGVNNSVVLALGATPEIASANRYAGSEVAGASYAGEADLVFTFATPLYLAPGTYWLAPFPVRDSNKSGWFFRQRVPVNGSEAYFQNPSGDLTNGDLNAVPFSSLGFVSQPVDLAFRIEGSAVPEPGSVGLLTSSGLILAAFAKRGFRNARKSN